MDFERFTIDLNAKCTCGCMEGKRVHKIYRFPNGFGASVVANPHSNGFLAGGYRLLIIHFESDPPENAYCVTDDVIECHSWDDVQAGLQKVFAF